MLGQGKCCTMCAEVESRKHGFVSAIPLGTGASGLVSALQNDTSHDESNREAADAWQDLSAVPGFDVVIRLYHKKIYNLTYRLIGDLEEAADLTQETFVSAYKAYRRFRGSSEAVYPWLCRIAVNACRNRFKSKSRRVQHEALSLDEHIELEESAVTVQLADESGSPETHLERRELESKVQEAIQSLPPEYRMIVVLRDMHGLSYQEIAESTGVTMETLKTRLFRGRRMLRRRLEHYIGI